jgi:ATP-binding cassette subfamily C protein CydD
MSEVVAQRAAGSVKGRLRARLSSRLIEVGPLYARGERTGDLVHTATQGVEQLEAFVTQYQVAKYLALLVPVLVFILILLLDPWTLPILLFTGPLLLVFMALIGGRTRELARRRERELGWMSAHFLDMLQGLSTLKMFGRSKEQADTIGAISRSHESLTMDVLRVAFQTSLVLELGATAATALVAITVSVRLMDGLLPFDAALTVLLLTPEFFQPLRRLSLNYHAGSAGRAAAERIYTLLDLPVPARPAPAVRRPVPASMSLRFDDVHFAYDRGERPALNGLTFELPARSVTALRGPSGAGKTTVSNLLLRFAEPDRGGIYVDDVPLNEIDPYEWRAHVSWVPQHPYFFHGTIAENLRMARPGASEEALIAAATAAHAHEFIVCLPIAYDTPIGERGVRLSGGQLQRLAIARAFLRDAKLLIFDEPTSNIGPESERQLRAAMAKLLIGRTAIIIAHGPGLVQQIDLLVDMDHGRVTTTRRSPEPDFVAGAASISAAGAAV